MTGVLKLTVYEDGKGRRWKWIAAKSADVTFLKELGKQCVRLPV
jgi:hypothetical protein